jgi:hypothetical protein
MKGEIRAGICAVAAVMLVACASKGPASSTAVAAKNAGDQDATSAEYQRLIENATNQRICKRRAVTGSRVDRIVCLTRAEMAEQQKNADEVMREMRQSAAMRETIPDRPQMPQTPPPTRP